MSFLSEASRNHFREVLEFLETLGIPYKINNALIGNRKYCSETIFEIVDLDYDAKKSKGNRTLAVGVRYDGLSKKVGAKKDIPGVGLSLLIKGSDPALRKPLLKTKKPWVYFIQLGFEAKLLSLHVIEILRNAKIPLYQSLPKDKLGAQVSHAEKLDLPYTILMGKKEAVEKSVLVRDSKTRSQEAVLFDNLTAYMKKLGESLRNN
jgi:histidyl-tRNA synthetase